MNFNELTLTKLKELAKEKGIKNISKLKKEDLILSLQKAEDPLNISENTKINSNSETQKNFEPIQQEGYRDNGSGRQFRSIACRYRCRG